jgi:hypothetical protein
VAIGDSFRMEASLLFGSAQSIKVRVLLI